MTYLIYYPAVVGTIIMTAVVMTALGNSGLV